MMLRKLGSYVVAVASVGLNDPVEVRVFLQEFCALALVTFVEEPRIVAQIQALALIVNGFVFMDTLLKTILELDLAHEQLKVQLTHSYVEF